MTLQTGSATFATHAERIVRAGFAVIPIDGKKPLVAGFNNMRRAPGLPAIAKQAGRYPDANIGILTGLSNVVVVDSDDMEADAFAGDTFGSTPLVTVTKKGTHRFYRCPPGVGVRNASLRKFGYNIDIKSGAGYVVAPPSIHPSGIPYRLLGSWEARAALPEFREGALARLLISAERPSDGETVGNRAQGLNDRLCREVSFCDALDELIDVACTLNAGFHPPLEEAEVVRVAARVWADAKANKIKRWIGRPSVLRIGTDEMLTLMALSPAVGSDGVVLLLRLRGCHGGRCKRGETFSITPKAMVRGQVMQGWSRSRIEKARDLLIEGNFIVRTRAFRHKGEGALYRLGVQNV